MVVIRQKRLTVLPVLQHIVLAAGLFSSWQPVVVAMQPESSPAVVSEEQSYLARIQLHTSDEMDAFFKRADQLLLSRDSYSLGHPIAFVLHGPEVDLFAREQYAINKELIDKAAQLDAFGVIDVKVCETYMKSKGIKRESLPAFIDVVPYGPDYEQSLQENGYVEF